MSLATHIHVYLLLHGGALVRWSALLDTSMIRCRFFGRSGRGTHTAYAQLVSLPPSSTRAYTYPVVRLLVKLTSDFIYKHTLGQVFFFSEVESFSLCP